MNIGVQLSVWVPVFNFWGYTPGSGIAGSYGSSIFNVLRNLHIVFHSSCPSLHFHQQFMVPFSPNPHYKITLLISCPFDNRHLTGVRWDLIVFLICIPVMLYVFSCICWPYVCLLWKNVYSDPLNIFKLDFLFSCSWVVGVSYIFWIVTSYQMYGL